MNTDHRILIGDARSMDNIPANSVELVVTSPPYPMIEMWDEVFAELNAEIRTHLSTGDGEQAFQLMHEELATVWEECQRVLVDGGILCINIGDATRKVDDSFRIYQNHARVIDHCNQVGFEPLPSILWHKPTNSGAKFMGSGTTPPNQYVTLEHEHILVFRNGTENRTPETPQRRRSSYFWEERNEWFTDVWSDIHGTDQRAKTDHGRERTAAYPLTIPYRLINMYSLYEDTVLDPFLGTGTTTIAAAMNGRNSVGVEISPDILDRFEQRMETVPSLSEEWTRDRIEAHIDYADEALADGEQFNHTSERYNYPVKTKGEGSMVLYYAHDVTRRSEWEWEVTHEPLDADWDTEIGRATLDQYSTDPSD